jgi:hypothetical protein
MRTGTVLMGMLSPFSSKERVELLASKQITAFASELIPRISRAQSMDILSSQAAVSGYQTVLLAAARAPKFFPMLTYAAGTIRPSRVLVIGAGVAGLQAIATAKRLGAIVEAYDVRAETKEQIESLGAKFVDTGVSASGAGGYARELTDEEKAMMKTSLAIKNWEVVLSSSSRNVVNQEYSLIKEAQIREGAPERANLARPGTSTLAPGVHVMGIRVHFPTEMYHGWALVKPPFEIPAYQDTTTVDGNGNMTVAEEERGKGRMFDNIGVVKNIGVLKSVSVLAHGLNFPHKLSIILKNSNNEEEEIMLGHLQFDGWRRLQWDNPNYVLEVRNRDLRLYPLYPKTTPMRKLVGIRIYRDGMHEGDDFIGYLKDICVVFDKAVLDINRDIIDEEVWGIVQQREEARRNAEMRRLGNIQVMRYLETQKMHKEETPAQQQQQQQQQP